MNLPRERTPTRLKIISEASSHWKSIALGSSWSLDSGASIRDRITSSQPLERRAADLARIAAAAGKTLDTGVVATVRQAVVDPELEAAEDDLLLGQCHERRMDLKPALFLDTRFRRQVGHRLERSKVFGT